MSLNYILYNPLANNKNGESEVKKIPGIDGPEFVLKNILDIKDYKEFISSLNDDDKIIIAGGDGTLNCFVNYTDGLDYKNRIYFYGMGSGNDFLRDISAPIHSLDVEVTEYLKDLPTVIIKDKKLKMINGIGYGIDGYCCQVGDRIRNSSDGSKPINYTSIAIKGILFHFKPVNAKITVDGKEYTFKKVWLLPTMNGRFYGGGIMPTPQQNRLGEDRKVSSLVYYGHGRLKTLIVFPSLFTGKHLEHKDMCKVFSGKHIKVQFDRPVAAQIDGETFLNVSEYEVVL